jgi:phytoene dehydrogenase-like protein
MTDVLIIGAGLAGLAAGQRLAECGVTFQIHEAADAVGGRVRTDVVEGFRLDRGFQIFLPSYPEARRLLDYAALDLKRFTPGAMVRFGGRFHRVADPRHEPITALKSLFNPIGRVRDKLRLAQLKRYFDQVGHTTPNLPTRQFLEGFGFTKEFLDRLAVPFFGGVFLDPDLQTSARFLRFVFGMFADGPGAVPALGMQAIPEQMASRLPRGCVHLNSPVDRVENGRVTLATGEVLNAKAVIVAVPPPAANRLGLNLPVRRWNGNTTHYYAATRSPLNEPILAVRGERPGHVNTVVVMSDVAATYAPPGASVISVSLIGTPGVPEDMIRAELVEWFGSDVRSWRHLRSDVIPESLPMQIPTELDPWQRPNEYAPGVWLAGDHLDNASIDGALTSGTRAAQAAMQAL